MTVKFVSPAEALALVQDEGSVGLPTSQRAEPGRSWDALLAGPA